MLLTWFTITTWSSWFNTRLHRISFTKYGLVLTTTARACSALVRCTLCCGTITIVGSIWKQHYDSTRNAICRRLGAMDFSLKFGDLPRKVDTLCKQFAFGFLSHLYRYIWLVTCRCRFTWDKTRVLSITVSLCSLTLRLFLNLQQTK
jgi:hypothetical protein